MKNDSVIEELRWRCKKLKLGSIVEAYLEQSNNISTLSLPYQTKLLALLDHELAVRDRKRTIRLIRDAGIAGSPASLEKMLYREDRNLDPAVIAELAQCRWINGDLPLVLTISGATGVGKTWLAQALGRCACEKGLSVTYYRMLDFLARLNTEKANGTIVKFQNRLKNRDLIILDDFGMGALSEDLRDEIFSFMDSRIGYGGLILTSQYPSSAWYEYFGEAHMADALMDRITNREYPIMLKGRSLREMSRPRLPL